jgi:archaemetzincin
LTKSSRICIYPIGFIEQDILERVARCVETRFEINCTISPAVANPRYAYAEDRQQYNSKLILKRLLHWSSQDIFRSVGVTRVDIFVPILKYVFGVAQLQGSSLLISTHRLRPEFYEQSPDRSLLLERVEKTALHELGHSLGLRHCIERRCVMYSSARIEDTDRKRTDFCPTCRELFKWYLAKSC